MIKLSLSQSTSSLTSTLLILSSVPPVGEGASSYVMLSCRMELNHDKYQPPSEMKILSEARHAYALFHMSNMFCLV